jgi:PAS domain S-box-containing protein
MQPDRDGIRVLHVDDDRDFAELTAAVLERDHDPFTVETAASAADAMERLSGAGFDCVVSDYDMPGEDGIAFLGTVRAEFPDLPFILFTGKGSEQVASEAISAGVTDYLQKGTGSEQYELLANRITTAVGQYRAERELERQSALFEKAQDIAGVGAWEYEPGTDRPPYVTDEALRIHGLDPGEEISLGDSLECVHDDDVAAVEAALARTLTEGDPFDLEVRLVGADGDRRWVRGRGEPTVSDGDIVRLRGTLSDITERKERERRLERQNKRLEELAHVISHDIRTPLQLAMGHLDIAERTGEAEAFERVREAHERIETLTGDILTLARQGLHIGSTETVALDRIARAAHETVDHPALELRTVGDLTTEGDPDRLRQLFENLFRNSVEHGSTGSRTESDDAVEHGLAGSGPDSDGTTAHRPPGRRPATGTADHGRESITVSVGSIEPFPTSTRETGEHSFGFYVSDDGPGIPEDERETVFDPGYSTANGGTGFGLAIVERIVEAHGWQISVTESHQGGARFEIVG